MKRYHDEKHIIDGRIKKYRQINAGWLNAKLNSGNEPKPLVETGRYRKTVRCSGCGRARCQICHPEKYPKRIPTRQEQQAARDFKTEDQ